jgi:hypothetical protein
VFPMCVTWPTHLNLNIITLTIQCNLDFTFLTSTFLLIQCTIYWSCQRFHKRNVVLYCIVFILSDKISIGCINTISIHTCSYESSYLSVTYYITR